MVELRRECRNAGIASVLVLICAALWPGIASAQRLVVLAAPGATTAQIHVDTPLSQFSTRIVVPVLPASTSMLEIRASLSLQQLPLCIDPRSQAGQSIPKNPDEMKLNLVRRLRLMSANQLGELHASLSSTGAPRDLLRSFARLFGLSDSDLGVPLKVGDPLLVSPGFPESTWGDHSQQLLAGLLSGQEVTLAGNLCYTRSQVEAIISEGRRVIMEVRNALSN